jgi:hypothetical protein
MRAIRQHRKRPKVPVPGFINLAADLVAIKDCMRAKKSLGDALIAVARTGRHIRHSDDAFGCLCARWSYGGRKLCGPEEALTKSVEVVLAILVEIDNEYSGAQHAEDIISTARRTFSDAKVKLLKVEVADPPDAKSEESPS